MRARLYIPGSRDAASLDRLLDHNRAGNVDLGRDRIIVVPAGLSSEPSGVLVWRPCAFVHDLYCGTGLSARSSATAMVNFAVADGISRPWPVKDVLFMVDSTNSAMLRYVRELGAVEQDGIIFTMDVSPGGSGK